MAQKDKTPEVIAKLIPARLDKKMGLGIIHSNQQVYVSSLIPGSLAAEHFKVNDRIVSIMGVPVTDKAHCRDLILLASDSRSQFEIVIERPQSSFVMPESKPQEVFEIPDLQSHPENPPTPPKQVNKDKDKDKEKKRKPAPIISYQSYMGDTELTFGDPLNGLQFPMAKDVREILTRKMPQILKDFLETPQEKPKIQKDKTQINFELDTKIVQHKISTDVNKHKRLMKPKR